MDSPLDLLEETSSTNTLALAKWVRFQILESKTKIIKFTLF